MDEITAKPEQINLTPETLPTPNKHKAPRPPSADEAWIHKRLVEDCEGILFVGESVNRSLPIAIAAMRGSWNNIWASSLEETWDMLTPDGEAPMEQILEAARTRAKYNAGLVKKRGFYRAQYDNDRCKDPEWGSEHVNELIENLSFALTSDITIRFSLKLDARSLHLDTQLRGGHSANANESCTRNIWFQCPWSSSLTPASLILQFLTSAAKVQMPGDAIFLGLTAKADTCYQYKLPEVLKHANSLGYDLRPVDRCCIRRAIDLGYVHQRPGDWQMDHKLLYHHDTYVFVKRDAKEAIGFRSSYRLSGA